MKWRKPIQTMGTMPESDPNETVTELGYGLSLGLTPLSPPRGQGIRRCHRVAQRGEVTRRNCRAQHPSRQSFGTARRIRTFVRKPLGLNPYAGRSCPDPGRLSTFRVSGLYPCRRLT
jgi:hypothetical protein